MNEKGEKIYLHCKEHGKVLWREHVICINCGRLYQLEDDKAELFAPEDCVCGCRLMPDEKDPDDTFFARSICGQCFDENKPRMKSQRNSIFLGDEREIRRTDREVFSALTSGSFGNFALFPCMVNGEPSAAIVSLQENEDESVGVCPHFVAVTKTMLVTDYEGNSPGEDPEDKKTH